MTDNRDATASAGMVSDLMRPLIAQAEELTSAVKQDGLDRRRENKRILVVAVALFLLLVLNVGVLLQNRSRSTQNGEIIRNSAQTNQIIADCTTPGRPCYQENLKNQAALLTRLLTAEMYVAQCAKVTNTDDEMETCVNERLKAAGIGLQINLDQSPPASGAEPSASPTPSTAQDEDVTP